MGMILLTGAGGFVGRHVISDLVQSGLRVAPLYRGEKVKISNDRWELNLTLADHVRELKEVKEVPDVVIHLAGRVEIALQPNKADCLLPPLPGMEDISALYDTNVVAAANILDFCLHRGVRHLIYISSQTVYGLPDSETVNEGSPCAPLEHYAASKLCGEHVLRIGACQGIAVTCLRIPGIYAEDRTDGVVYRYCSSAIRDRNIFVQADLPLPFDVIHVADVVEGIRKAVRHGGDGWICLNMATGEPCSLDLLADSIAELIPGCHVRHAKVPQPTLRMDSSLADRILGWKAMPRSNRLAAMLNYLRHAA